MGLIHWWPLNGNCDDYGMNPVKGSIISEATFSPEGKIGKCLKEGGYARGINVPTNLTTELGTEYSAACWIWLNGTHVHYNGTFISSGDWNHSCWAFGINQANTAIDAFGPRYNRYVTYPGGFQLHKWYHITSVMKDGYATVYVNGEKIGSYNYGNATLTSDASNLTIGRETYAGGYFGFNGRLNDMRIYNHALSTKEVKELAKTCVLNYSFNDPLIEGTTNLITSLDPSLQSFTIGSHSGFTNQSAGELQVVEFQGRKCLKMIAKGSSQRAYFTCKGLLASTYTCSVDVYCSKTRSGALHIERYGGGHNWDGGSISYTTPNQWQRLSLTLTNKGTTTYYFFITGDVDVPIYCKNFQIEHKDHATPFTTNIRPGICYDNSGFRHHGTINGLYSIVQDSPVGTYSLLADETTITTNQIFFDNVHQCHTINFWVNNFESIPDSIIVNFNDEYKLYTENELYSGSAAELSWDAFVIGEEIPVETWTMITWVVDSSNTVLEVYYNGILHAFSDTYEAGEKLTGFTNITEFLSGVYGKITDLKIFATALSSEDIKDLYNEGVYVSSAQEVGAREFIETNNFNIGKNGVLSALSFEETDNATIKKSGTITASQFIER